MSIPENQLLLKAVMKVARILGINMEDIARMLDISTEKMESSAITGAAVELNEVGKANSLLLVQLFKALSSFYGNDKADMRRWMRSENQNLRGRPIDLLRTEQGLQKIWAYLEASLHRH